MLARQQLKVHVYDFLGKTLGEINRYQDTLANQDDFDSISMAQENAIEELASFLDKEIASHAILKHTDISKFESPNIKQMPCLIERQNQYLIYLKAFFFLAANNNIDKDILEKFKQAIINCISNNDHHLLKRAVVTSFILWRENDSFSPTNPMIKNLITTLNAPTTRPSNK